MKGDLYQTEDRDELYIHHSFVVDKGQTPIRVDKYLVDRIENATRSKIQQAADAGNIIVNEKSVKSNYKVKPEDVVLLVLDYPIRELEIIPENIPLDIVYEDDQVIVVNKKPGMVVHPSYGHYTGTLVNALAWHLRNIPAEFEGDLRPGLVHRIDKDTSGLLVIAKTEHAKSHLGEQFYNHTVKRRYLALIWGSPPENEGTITGNIGRSLKNRKTMAVFEDGEMGKHAVTHYRVIERFSYVTLVECRLETGRTHQIRVHMKYIGNPIFNDQTYGGDQILKGTTFSKYNQFIRNCFEILPRQALHAQTLGFIHPETQELLDFYTDIPPDMYAVIQKWRRYTTQNIPE